MGQMEHNLKPVGLSMVRCEIDLENQIVTIPLLWRNDAGKVDLNGINTAKGILVEIRLLKDDD
jgi:hypothetical protein